MIRVPVDLEKIAAFVEAILLSITLLLVGAMLHAFYEVRMLVNESLVRTCMHLAQINADTVRMGHDPIELPYMCKE